MICEDLAPDECRALIRIMQNDREQNDDLLLQAHASEFEDAWLDWPANSANSFRWAMNQEHLVYRLHLIPLLTDWRLFGLPATT